MMIPSSYQYFTNKYEFVKKGKSIKNKDLVEGSAFRLVRLPIYLSSKIQIKKKVYHH